MHTQSGKPQVLEVNPSGIPQELLALPNWVGWKLQLEEGKEKKIPLNAKTGRFASSTDSSTWSTVDRALQHYEQLKGHGVDGLCFMFSEDDQIAGIDLDDCRNPETGELNAFAKSILERMNSYTEKSPSGEGLHIFVKGNLPGKGINLGNIEMYDNKRFFTVTGQALAEYPSVIEERDEALKALYHEVTGKDGQADEPQSATGNPLVPMDAELMARGTAKYGPRFQDLWSGRKFPGESKSQGDLGFCTMISVLAGGNAHEIDRVFRLSGRMRDKWDEVHYADGRTYGQGTIEKAAAAPLEEIEKHKTISMPQTAGASPSRETDVGNGKRLVANHGKDLRYCHQMKTWLIWTGQRWQVDTTQMIMQYAKDTAAAIWQEVDAATDESRRRELVRHAKASESHSKLKAMVACAQSEEEVAITLDDLDQDHMLFNCENGTLDLRTGQFRPHRREDLITKLAPVSYNPVADWLRWKQFINEVMAGDQEKIAFLQKAVGYSLTGDTREQCLFYLLGLGGNGKSTLLDILKAVMGRDYAYQAAGDTFIYKGIGQIPHDLAGMRGSRLVTLPDSRKGYA